MDGDPDVGVMAQGSIREVKTMSGLGTTPQMAEAGAVVVLVVVGRDVVVELPLPAEPGDVLHDASRLAPRRTSSP